MLIFTLFFFTLLNFIVSMRKTVINGRTYKQEDLKNIFEDAQKIYPENLSFKQVC